MWVCSSIAVRYRVLASQHWRELSVCPARAALELCSSEMRVVVIPQRNPVRVLDLLATDVVQAALRARREYVPEQEDAQLEPIAEAAHVRLRAPMDVPRAAHPVREFIAKLL